MAIEITKIVTAIEKQIPPIPVVQSASGHIIEFELTDTVGETAEPIDLTDNLIDLIGFKPSGLPITIAGEVIDGNSGQCRVQLTEQALAETGDCDVQLILTGAYVLKTLKFTIRVLPSIILEDIESVPEYQALESALTQVQAAITTVTALDTMAGTITTAYQIYVTGGGSLPIEEWLAGFTGEPGQGVPTGGTPGQILCKQSYNDYDAVWGDPLAGGVEIDLSAYTIGVGTISTQNGEDRDNNTRLRTKLPFWVYKGTRIIFSNSNANHTLSAHIYDISTSAKGYEWIGSVTNLTDYTVDTDCYVRFVFLNGSSTVTEATYEEFLTSLTILSPKPPLQQPDGPPLPYFGKEIRDTAAAVGAESGLKLAVFTDIHCYYPIYGRPQHLSWGHFRNVKAVAERTHVDAIACLGDMTFGYTFKSNTCDTHAMISCWSKALPAPYLQCDGNHDENYYYGFGGSRRYDEILTPQELASFYYHPNDVYHRQYFYNDIPEHKTRIIVLNSNDAYVLDGNGNPKYNKEETSGGVAATYAFMPQQIQWLAQLLHDTERDCEGWDVVVCSHQSVCPTGSGSTQVPKNTAIVWGLLTAFNGGTSYTGSTTDGDFSVSVDETYDGACQIPVTLYGHKHYDRAFTEDGILCVCIASSLCVEANTSDSGATVPTRTPYTASEDAWDVVCITPEKVKMIRFGAGSDREFNR